jgi:histidyl-tRNA synthetase
VGWALGVDRTVLALRAEGVEPAVDDPVEVFAVPIGPEAVGPLFGIVTELRRAGIRADLAYGGRGLKGSMKAADRSGAARALVVGERDLADGVAQVKDLTSGEQVAVPLTELVARLQEELR